MSKCANCGHAAPESFAYCPSCGTRAEPGAGGLIGSTLNDKYRIRSELGQGSMGTVYLAEHVSLRKRIAIKILHRDLQLTEEGMQRFQREGIAAGQVTHPNAIQIFDFDRTADGQIFLAMEYVEGANLKEVLVRETRLDTDTSLRLTRQLLSALIEAHTNGIVHRDLKPENLMIVDEASGERTLKVLDFGLSKLVDRPLGQSMLTQPGRVLGTPMYMAPEQWRGEDADARTDLHATAAVLFEMLTGSTPFHGKDITELMLRSTTQDPPELAEVAPDVRLPTGLEKVVRRGLARSRADRYQTASEMLDALRLLDRDAAAAPQRARTRRAPRAQRASGSGDSKKPLWIGAGAIGVAMAIAGAMWFGGEGKAADPSGPEVRLVRAKPEDQRTVEERSYLRLLDAATKAIHRKDASTALETVADALGMACADAEGFVVRADVFRSRGDRESALADLAEALDRAPGYGLALARRGWIQLEAGERDAAEREFRAARTADPSCGEAYAGAAAARLEAGDAAAAIAVLDQAPEGADAAPQRQLYRGLAQMADGQWAEATQSFVAAKRGDDSLWRAYAGLGDAYLEQDRLSDAEREYREALARGPAAETAVFRRRLAAMLMTSGSALAAREVLGPASRDAVHDGEVRVLRAALAIEEQDYGSAEKLLREALQLPLADAASAHQMLGGVYLNAENWAAAEEAFGAACDLDDDRADAYFGWGIALFRMERYVRAAARFRKATSIDPGHLAAQLNAAIVYRDYLGRNDTALAALRAYQAAGGSDPRVPGWIRALQN